MSSVKTAQVPAPIDLVDLWNRFLRILKRMWILVLALGLILGSVFYFWERKSFVPMYEADALFSVNSGCDAYDIFTAGYYDNAAAKQLAETFPYILSTDLMMDLMKEDLGKSYINGEVTPSALANTNLLSLSVQSNSGQDAYDILWAAINSFPQIAVYMVDYPQVVILEEPKLPTEPNNTFDGARSAVKGCATGSIIGLGFVFLVALNTSSVYSVQQLKELVSLPILAVLPAVQRKKRRTGKAQFVMESTNPEIRETIRSLSRKVQKNTEQLENKVILVTSTLKSEGKTTIATNLAFSLARDGHRVALVDADLNSQGVAQRLSLQPCQYGLWECMKDPKLGVLECMSQVPDLPLWVLCGASSVQRNYSIDLKGMCRVIDELRNGFDYVIVDSSPCALVAETMLLCHYAGSVLFVVRPDYANRHQILDTVNELSDRGVNIAGMVYNGAQMSHSSYGYGYGYGYSNQKRKHR